jgi:hypothetical protein
MGDWWNQPMRPDAPPADAAVEGDHPAVCPWCSAPATGAPVCPSCGAVMAQRESLGGLVIPGVTDVDSNLAPPGVAAGLLHGQAVQNRVAIGVAMGSPVAGLVVVGAAAVLAKDAISGTFQSGAPAQDVGRPSDAAVAMLRQLETEPSAPPASPADLPAPRDTKDDLA